MLGITWGRARPAESKHGSSPTDPCPDCGGTYFAPGGPTVTHHHDGESAEVRTSSALLACCNCGSRWYGTPKGLQRPHEAVMPERAAVAQLQRQLAHEVAVRNGDTRTDDKKRRPPARPNEGYRMPPKP